MKNTHLLLPVVAFVIFAFSCEERNRTSQNDTVVSTDSVTIAEESVEPFPDTMYASVELLTYKIDTFCTDVKGDIADIKDLYANVPGIFCFRGGPLRDMPYSGRVTGRPSRIEVDWCFKTDMDQRKVLGTSWGGGSGWTGQPLYIKWPHDKLERIKRENNHLTSDFDDEEIIVASLCSKVYFINFNTGKASREAMETRNPVKGTPSIDPRLNGNYYLGQGLPCEQPFGAVLYNLFTNEQKSVFGMDQDAWRNWGAYDSNPIVVGDFLIRPGENGTLYKFLAKTDTLIKHTTLRYHEKKGWGSPGMESSIAVCRNYGYVGDNKGNILCVNLNTMKPVWCYWNHDDTDATIVLEIEDGIPYLYTSCECDKQGQNGYSYFTKLNGLNGDTVWVQPIPCHKRQVFGSEREGGMFSTPLIGHGNCEGLIFANFCTLDKPNLGRCCCIDKKTGRIIYSLDTELYLWSSPIAYYNEKDELFVLFGDIIGNLYLIDGKTGEILVKEKFGNNFESSPIPIGNCAVVGSRGREIYKFSIK